ncbi:MAG: hypothetical protein IH609_16940 [Dehalococcoidia bacterium]|nr:hypothetical protein [Dehalococcoidia bacterium]
MQPSPQHSRSRRFLGAFDDPQVRVSLVAAVALLVQAVLAKNVLDVELDIISQYAALWVFVAYLASGARSRSSEIIASVAVVAVTAAVLLVASL